MPSFAIHGTECQDQGMLLLGHICHLVLSGSPELWLREWVHQAENVQQS